MLWLSLCLLLSFSFGSNCPRNIASVETFLPMCGGSGMFPTMFYSSDQRRKRKQRADIAIYFLLRLISRALHVTLVLRALENPRRPEFLRFRLIAVLARAGLTLLLIDLTSYWLLHFCLLFSLKSFQCLSIKSKMSHQAELLTWDFCAEPRANL